MVVRLHRKGGKGTHLEGVESFGLFHGVCRARGDYLVLLTKLIAPPSAALYSQLVESASGISTTSAAD